MSDHELDARRLAGRIGVRYSANESCDLGAPFYALTEKELDKFVRELGSLRQVPDGYPVAWTVVGPDGKSSIGGWMDISIHDAAKDIAVLRDGHRYAYAYEANPAPPTSGQEFHGIKIVEAPAQEEGTAIFRDDNGRVLGTITGIETTPAQAGAELPELPDDGYRPTESECTDAAARYFYREGYNAARLARRGG